MKLKEDVEKILEKYNLEVNIPEEYKTVYAYEKEHPDKCEEEFYDSELNDSTLLEKYKKHIPKGWYGFSMGSPTPNSWYKAIDEILQLCIKNDPDFEINQIKMKFGGIRFYVESQVIEDMLDIEIAIERNLHSSKLIY